MKPPPEVNAENVILKQRAAFEEELRLTKNYWLESIWPYIEGRPVIVWSEYLLVHESHWRLGDAVKKAAQWNESLGPDTVHSPITIDVNWAKNFRAPTVPATSYAENMAPESLAATAALLIKSNINDASPAEAIRKAHELIMAAELYIGTLPPKPHFEPVLHFPNLQMSLIRIHFKTIAASSQNSVPWLPSLQAKSKEKRKAKTTKPRLDASPLSLNGVKAAVERFLKSHGMNADEASKHDYVINSHISLEDLSLMRWERFKDHSRVQQLRANNRSAKKAKKLAKQNTKLTKSAA
jgi:hypothetical protein